MAEIGVSGARHIAHVATAFSNLHGERAGRIQTRAGLELEGQPAGTAVREERLDNSRRIPAPHVHVQVGVRESLPQRLHGLGPHRRQRAVRRLRTVEDVHVEPVGAGVQNGVGRIS